MLFDMWGGGGVGGFGPLFLNFLDPPLIDTNVIASSARPTFASSLIDVFSFVLRCFRFFEPFHEVSRVSRLHIT